MWAALAAQLDRWFFPLIRLLVGYAPGTYEGPGEVGPGLARAAAPSPADVRLAPAPVPGWAPPGSKAWQFQFPSPFPDGEDPRVNTVHGRLLQVDPQAGWLVIVPGFLTGILGTGFGPFWARHARAAARAGLNVAVAAPPLHLGRHPAGVPSGRLLFTANLRRTFHAMEQAVAEVNTLGRWLRETWGRPVGLWGTSLGGAIAGMAAALWPGWQAAVLMEPLDDLPAVLWHTPAARGLCRELERNGVDRATFARLYSGLMPSLRRPCPGREQVLFIIPRFDQIIPMPLQERFWKRWDRPLRLDVDHGHLTAVSAREPVRAAVTHAARWLGPAPDPRSRR